jgi:hypothetical protein
MLRRTTGLAVAAGVLCLLLLIPSPDPQVPASNGTRPFTWNRDAFWTLLETQFREARARGCEPLRQDIDREFSLVRRLIGAIDNESVGPDDPRWVEIETSLFHVAPWVAACPERLLDETMLVTSVRATAKRQSVHWDMDSSSARERIYRLLYGGRAALEEALLQAPPGVVPALETGDPVLSRTPSADVHGVRIHSGDILVSRGGAPTSALIARGNDFPGNFSHIALVHVDASSAKVAIIEAHIEVGLGISSIEQYLDGKKLRVMVLRLRPDLPSMQADPLLPHKAASAALETARTRHVPYDFEMNYRDPSKQFCAEVVSAVYEPRRVRLWTAMSRLSSPGLRSWLAAFGVTHFETQEPSDLEYDPQLGVAAEWRDSETLFQDHVDNAVVDALLEEAEAGVRLGYPWWKLPFARMAKAYSALLNSLGRVGRIPEGMSAEAALRYEGFNDRHKALRDRLLAKANDFRQRNGYRPPYWELVGLARTSRSEALD